MSRHGIESLLQARNAYQETEVAVEDIRKAAGFFVTIAQRSDSPTLQRLANDLADEIEKAIKDSCLEMFAEDLQTAIDDWDGKEDFGKLFDLTCRLVVPE